MPTTDLFGFQINCAEVKVHVNGGKRVEKIFCGLVFFFNIIKTWHFNRDVYTFISTVLSDFCFNLKG